MQPREPPLVSVISVLVLVRAEGLVYLTYLPPLVIYRAERSGKRTGAQPQFRIMEADDQTAQEFRDYRADADTFRFMIATDNHAGYLVGPVLSGILRSGRLAIITPCLCPENISCVSNGSMCQNH